MATRAASNLARWRSRTVLMVLSVSPWVLLRATAEPFHLPKATVVLLAGIALGALLVVSAAEERSFHLARTPFLVPFMLYVAAALLVTVTSADRALSLWGEYRYFVGSLLLVAITLVVVALLRDPELRRYRAVALAIAAGAVPVTLYALMQLIGADPLSWSGETQGVFSTMANPNFLAGYLGIVFPLVVMVPMLPRLPSLVRAGAVGLAVAMVVIVLGTASFQGPVGLLVGAALPLGLLLRRRARRRVFLGGIAVGLVLAAVLAGLLAAPIWAQISDGLRERTMMWEAALDIFRSHPVTGTGFATFGLFFTPNRPAAHAQTYGFVNPEQAHNVALNHLAEGGLMLFLPWLAAVVVVAYLLVRGLRQESADRQLLLAGFGGTWLAYQSQGLVSIDLPVSVLLHWTAAAVIAGLTVRQGEAWAWNPVGPKRGGTPYQSALSAGVVVGSLILVWFVLVPVRADIAAATGFKTINRGDVRSGTVQIEKATELAPYRATYWLLLASAREGAGDERRALEALREAASRDVGSSQQALALGRLADRTGELDLASEWYERAVRRDPLNPAVLGQAATFFDSIGEFERAEELQARTERARLGDV